MAWRTRATRHTGPDPLGLRPAPSPVAWVHNPNGWGDSLGLTPCEWVLADEKYDKRVLGRGRGPRPALSCRPSADHSRKEFRPMIHFHFSRDAEQCDGSPPSGCDVGHMNVTGDLGSATSQGHCPDQGMMIYLSVSLLLQHLTRLYRSRKQQKFVGVDSSFTVGFRPTRLGIMVSCNGVLTGHVQLRELFAEVSRAVDEFCAKELPVLPDGDTGRKDLLRSLERFRLATGIRTDSGS